jgi:predicted nuclease with TOPRIM domain
MQEKVHFTPPVVQLYEGKPPPNSWVEENIVRFLQVKSEHEFLTDFVSFLQNKAAENLAKTKQAGKPVLVFSYLPEGEGSAKDIANSALFNLLQSHEGTQIKTLIKLVQILKGGNPRAAKELDSALDQLNQIAASFPQVSQEQLKTLEELMSRFLEMAKKMPPSAQKAFWNELNAMLQKLYTNNNASLLQFQEEIEKAKNRAEELARFKAETTSILTLFSSGQIQQGLSQFVSLMKNYKNLPPDLREILATALSKLGKMSGKNVSLAQLLAEAQLSQWIQKLGGKPTREQLVDYIQRQMKEPPFNSMSPPFMSDFLGALNKSAGHPEFPENPSSLGPKYEETEAFSQSVETFTFDSDSVKGTADDVGSYLSGKQEEFVNKSGGYGEAASSSGGLGESYGRSAAWGAAQGASAGSLPNQFQHAILNHYMPNQEKYLMELAELLMFDNMGAEIGNALLNLTTDFSAAATNFDFSNFLHSDGKGQFSGTPTQAKAQLSKEQAAVSRDIGECNKAINKINSELKSIENNKNLTQSQKTQLEKQLNDIKSNLIMARGQLYYLQSILSTLTVEPGKDSKHFTIVSTTYNWQQDLSTGENIVINGNPKAKPPGGLVQIGSDINTFQQTYSDQGQNQQMMLQMRMTEIQQEWTVVSTALQILNQMYMSVAQAIYK